MATVLDEALGAPAPAETVGQQFDLLSDADEGADEEPGASPMDTALDRMAEGFSKPRRGRGRPAGSRNRRTEDWARLVLSTHRSPLLVLADFYSMPVEELARRLQCDLLDAAKLQITAARDLAPYVHQRLPQAVNLDVSGNLPVLHLHMGDPSGTLPAADAALEGVSIVMTDVMEKQGLSAPLVEHSEWVNSEGAAGDIGNAGEPGSSPTDLGSVK
ncbi:hypothetical protein [Azospirillum sp. B510]|uniref:hypothetical protein n=1 Tax=Azospirillum sp. (strain B510) TaxID=137722 RepID=UPI0003162C51|nr:hypothetical protein [Azospirillum sp. B510]